MRLAARASWWLVLAPLTFLPTLSLPLAAQDSTGERRASGGPPGVRIYIHTRLGNGADRAIGGTSENGRSALLASSLSSRLTEKLNARARAFALRQVRIRSLPADSSPPATPSFLVQTDVAIDGNRQVTVETTLLRAPEGVPLNRLLPQTFLEGEFGIEWSDFAGDAVTANRAVKILADSIAQKIEYSAYRWIIDSTVRFVVRVERFVNEGPDTSFNYLRELLRTALQTELNQSAALSLLESGAATRQAPGAAAAERDEANYSVRGTFAAVGRRLRVDVLVVKAPIPVRGQPPGPGRILASRRAVVDNLDLDTLSSALARLGREVRWAMEADFRQQKKTLAVVGVAAPRPGRTRPTPVDVAITRDIARTLTRKLAKLTIAGREQPLLDVTVRGPFEDDASGRTFDPFAWLAQTDADYLVVAEYEDVGDRVRLSTDLALYDPEHSSGRVPVRDRTLDKLEIAAEVDSALVGLVCLLGDYAVAGREPSGPGCRRVDTLVRSIVMPAIVRDRQVGLRVGASFERPSPNLFFNGFAGRYFEVYVSQLLPAIYPGLNGGRFAFGVEADLGLDTGDDLSLGGASVASVLVNGKIYLTSWQRSTTKANVVVGGGGGFIGLRYSFSPGDPHYTGTHSFQDTGFVPASDLFAQVEWPLWRIFEGDLVLRWIPPTEPITTFANTAEIDNPAGRVGRLGGVYLVAGAKVRF